MNVESIILIRIQIPHHLKPWALAKAWTAVDDWIHNNISPSQVVGSMILCPEKGSLLFDPSTCELHFLDVPPKATILVDVEGVVADFVGHVRDLTRQEPAETWHFWKDWPPEAIEDLLATLRDRGFWDTLPLMGYAKDQVEALKDHNVVFVTAPWTACKEGADARTKWLDNHFGVHPLIITDHKYLVEGDFFLDDKGPAVDKWADVQGGVPLWRVNPYTKSLKGRPVWHNWSGDILKFLDGKLPVGQR